MAAKESPFVGQERHELVNRLLAEFEKVAESGTPRWCSLEAPPGWGKTRIVQEFYRRLAAEQQPGAQYWPPSLIPEGPPAKNVGLSTSMRKRVYPEQVIPEQDAVPQWFWWGIACTTRSGTPVQALADDMTQFLQHKVGLQRRWGQLVSRMARLSARLSSKRGELVETSVGEGVGVAAGLANVAMPGLGLLVLATKWTAQGLWDLHYAGRGTTVVDAAGGGREDLVDELAPALERLGAAGLPIVITIEDLNLADESLVEMLARLLAAQDARVLVISTAWRGFLDDDSRPPHRLLERVAEDRVLRVLADEDLQDLDLREREEIVRAVLPDISAGNATLLAGHYSNPWALQLACDLGWVRRAKHDFTVDQVARLPMDIGELFKELWKQLPEDTHKALMLAALSTPTGISDSVGFLDARWDSSLLTAVSETEAWLPEIPEDTAAVMGQSSDAYAWIRVVDEWLRRFNDPHQHYVAVREAKREYDPSERLPLYKAMARRMSAAVPESPTQELHHARLLVALAMEGFLDWDPTTLAGAVTVCASLLAGPDVESRRYVVLIAENALQPSGAEPVGIPLLNLREQYGLALAESGKAHDAITVFDQLLTDRTQVFGPNDPLTLATRHHLAESVAEAGGVAKAITAFEQLLADRTRVLAPDAFDTLMTRQSLALWLGRSGRVIDAIDAIEQLLADQKRSLPPNAPATMATRENLAEMLGQSGQVDQAVSTLELLLADRTRVLAMNASPILITRHNLAEWRGRSGRIDQALTAFEQLLVDERQVFGPDAPATLATRHRQAWWLGRSGRLAQAVTAFEQLVADHTRVLGSYAPQTLSARNSLAWWLGRSGKVDKAITGFEQLLVDQRRVLGNAAPDTLSTRYNLAWWLVRAGRVEEAIRAFEGLLADQRRVLGPDSPATLATRHYLASSLGKSGQVGQAILELERVLADRTRVLGPDAPDTMDVRNSLAWWLGKSGRVDDAIRACEQLILDQRRVLGDDAAATLATRNSLAWWLGRSGKLAEAISAFEQLMADRTRVLGADAPQTLTTRDNLAESLAESGRVGDAITAFEQVMADETRVFGPDAPDTLATRSSLAWWLGQAGSLDRSITALEQVLADQRRVLGPDAPATLSTCQRLAESLAMFDRMDDALPVFEQVFAHRLRVLGPDAPETLATRSSLALWLGLTNRANQAITALERVLADQIRVLGPDAPDTLVTRKNLARLEQGKT